ncbi:HERC4 [Symbiodinium sp. CCMP2592]|nr:HERC4 [Symbiodinium sp. CCMP2592]
MQASRVYGPSFNGGPDRRGARLLRPPSRPFGRLTSLGWIWASLFYSLPTQVWAVPESWLPVMHAMQMQADLVPESLDVALPHGGDTSVFPSSEEQRLNLLTHVQNHDLQRPLENTNEIPVPPLHSPPEVGQLGPPSFAGVCYVLAPQYQAEVLRLTLSPPVDLATFFNAVRDGLQHLRLPHCSVLAPTVPQLGPDFASVVLAPKWLPQSGRQCVVFDFRAFDGPVYARIVHENLSHFDCQSEADFQGCDRCSIYVQGHSRALEAGDTFLATLGCTVQYRPAGESASWCCTLTARFDRPQWWLQDPQLPADAQSKPVLVLHGDRNTIYSASKYPGTPALRFLSDLVDRTPERMIFIAPPGDGLANVDFRGVTCRDVMAVFPLTPFPEREGVLVFLDARQAGQEITHIYLPSPSADPHYLVQYLQLRPPPCYRVAISPPGRLGTIHLAEGDRSAKRATSASARLRYASHADGSRQSKVLKEPTCGNRAEARTLRGLRDATRRLGGRWITDPPHGLPGFAQAVLETDDMSDQEEASSPCVVFCVVFKLDYTREMLHVTIDVPATPDELTQELRQARSPGDADQYPQLLPVLPQPSYGLALYIAHQIWNAAPDLVCIDTVDVDGRLFAVSAPPYATKADLVCLAGLLPAIDYDVYFGVDQDPVGDVAVHLFPGALVTFRHVGSANPELLTLGGMLETHLAWSMPHDLPFPHVPEAHCLVHRGTTRLCVDAVRDPMRYRDAISGVTGADPTRMRLFAAQPSPTNVAIRGVNCTSDHNSGSDQEDPVTEQSQQLRTEEGSPPVLMTFSVCTVDYALEQITIRLPVPTDITLALQHISHARSEPHATWFPRLLPVSHQPHSGSAFVLALPPWDGPGVPVLIENGFEHRFFVAEVPPLSQRHDFLAFVALPEGAETHVYVRDMPWPLLDGIAIQAHPGDLVSIQPANHAIVVLATLADMLRDREGWRRPPPSVPHGPSTLLLLADERQHLFQFDSARRHQLRHDLSRVPEDHMTRISPLRTPPHMTELGTTGWLLFLTIWGSAVRPNAAVHISTAQFNPGNSQEPGEGPDGVTTWTTGLNIAAQSCGPLSDTSALSGPLLKFPIVPAPDIVSVRPVATPCRVRVPAATIGALDDLGSRAATSKGAGGPVAHCNVQSEAPSGTVPALGIGPTLLEQSLRQTRYFAFYLARTLLETLVEHSHEKETALADAALPEHPIAMSAEPQTDGPRSRVLGISDHLEPCRVFNLTDVQTPIACSFDDIAPLVRPGHWKLASLPSIRLPGDVLDWLLQWDPCLDHISYHDLQRVEIYTDGSYDGRHSAWAFHVCALADDHHYHLGWQGNRLTNDPTQASCLGAFQEGAFSAEVSCCSLLGDVLVYPTPGLCRHRCVL